MVIDEGDFESVELSDLEELVEGAVPVGLRIPTTNRSHTEAATVIK